MLFAQECRARIVKENPDANFTDIGKLLGEQWKSLHDDERIKYVRLADTQRQKYRKLIEENETRAQQGLPPLKQEAIDDRDHDNKDDTSSDRELSDHSDEDDDNDRSPTTHRQRPSSPKSPLPVPLNSTPSSLPSSNNNSLPSDKKEKKHKNKKKNKGHDSSGSFYNVPPNVSVAMSSEDMSADSSSFQKKKKKKERKDKKIKPEE